MLRAAQVGWSAWREQGTQRAVVCGGRGQRSVLSSSHAPEPAPFPTCEPIPCPLSPTNTGLLGAADNNVRASAP